MDTNLGISMLLQLCLLFMLLYHSEAECEINVISVKAGFDIDQYTGVWYEVLTLLDSASTGEQYQDYVQNYTKYSNGSIIIREDGRLTSSSETCFTRQAELTETEVAGKYEYTRENSATRQYWILGTDYTSYSIVYHCISINMTTFKCDRPESRVLSRSSTLATGLTATLTTVISGVCLNYNDYTATSHTSDCPESSTENNSGATWAEKKSVMMSFTVTSIFIFKTVIK